MFPEDKVKGTFKANYKWTVGSKIKEHPEVQAEWPSWGLPLEMLTAKKQEGVKKERRAEKTMT